MRLTPTLTPTGARNGALWCAPVHSWRIQTPDSEAGGSGFEARLPLQLSLASLDFPVAGDGPPRESPARKRAGGAPAQTPSGLWRGDRAELPEQSQVVSGRPVFHDQAIGDPKDVDVLDRVRLSRGGWWDQGGALNTDPTVWQRIRRTGRSCRLVRTRPALSRSCGSSARSRGQRLQRQTRCRGCEGPARKEACGHRRRV